MEKTNKVLIIQLTRIGDIIQTLQAARQLRAENPDIEMSLLARKKFAKGIEFLLETVFDQLFLFDTKDFFIENKFQSAVSEVQSFTKIINENKFDLLVNLSFDKSSSYLSNLINAKVKFGIQRNNLGEVVIQDKWSQFVYSNTMVHPHSPFSLVDIYRYIMGVNQNLILNNENPVENRAQNIVLHPFASQKKKKWGMNKWSELIYKMAKDHPEYHFHIVGSPEDKAEAQRLLHTPALQNFKDRITSTAGKKDIKDVYQLLCNSRLFIGHDSMVAHLASETMTPTVVISLGTVRPTETTPFSDQVINVSPKNDCFPCDIQKKCELLPCHNSINYQVISSLANGIIAGEEIDRNWIETKINTFHLNMIRIHRSFYNEDGLELLELTNNYDSVSESFKKFYKVIWLYYLRGTETNNSLPNITPETAYNLSNYSQGINYLYELYNFGVKYSNKIIQESEKKDIDLNFVQENINKIGEIDQLCNITKKSYPELKSLVNYFYVNKANALGDNLIEISKSNLLNYYDASNLVAVLGDFIDKTISPFIDNKNLDKEV